MLSIALSEVIANISWRIAIISQQIHSEVIANISWRIAIISH